MMISVLTVFSFATQPSYGASGSITLNPTVFSHSATSTIVLANGGTFASGATIKFYAGTTTSLTSSNTVIGTYSLQTGVTTLSNAAVTFNPSSIATGKWYIAASDDSGSTFTGSVAITVTSVNPKITLSSTSATPGSIETLTGSGFDSGSTVGLYLSYVTGTTLIGAFFSFLALTRELLCNSRKSTRKLSRRDLLCCGSGKFRFFNKLWHNSRCQFCPKAISEGVSDFH